MILFASRYLKILWYYLWRVWHRKVHLIRFIKTALAWFNQIWSTVAWKPEQPRTVWFKWFCAVIGALMRDPIAQEDDWGNRFSGSLKPTSCHFVRLGESLCCLCIWFQWYADDIYYLSSDLSLFRLEFQLFCQSLFTSLHLITLLSSLNIREIQMFWEHTYYR